MSHSGNFNSLIALWSVGFCCFFFDVLCICAGICVFLEREPWPTQKDVFTAIFHHHDAVSIYLALCLYLSVCLSLSLSLSVSLSRCLVLSPFLCVSLIFSLSSSLFPALSLSLSLCFSVSLFVPHSLPPPSLPCLSLYTNIFIYTLYRHMLYICMHTKIHACTNTYTYTYPRAKTNAVTATTSTRETHRKRVEIQVFRATPQNYYFIPHIKTLRRRKFFKFHACLPSLSKHRYLRVLGKIFSGPNTIMP